MKIYQSEQMNPHKIYRMSISWICGRYVFIEKKGLKEEVIFYFNFF